MSDTTASLRRKIDGAVELKSVVRTMKAVAASSIEQYERSVVSLAEYSRIVDLGLSASLLLTPAPVEEPRPDPKNRSGCGAIVFGSDQGLIGQFNDVIAELTVSTLDALPVPAKIWAVGARVQARLLDAGLAMSGRFAVPGSVAMITALVEELLLDAATLFERTHSAELHLFYNCPTSGAGYSPVHKRLLPLDANWVRERRALHWPTRSLPEVLGEATATLRSFVGEYIFCSLFRACAESLASENASRLAAMQRAEKSIDESLDTLNASFHRLRQDSIDTELFDVIIGSEALVGDGLS